MVDPVVLSGITSMADGIQKRADGFLKRYPGADYGNMGSMSSAQCTRRARELERKSKTAGYEISGLKDDFAILTARAARDTKQGRPDPLAKVTLDQAQGGAMDAILRCEAAASSYGKQAGVLREQAATKREMEIIENGGKGGGGRGLLQSMGSPLIKVLSGAVAAGVIVGGFLLAKPCAPPSHFPSSRRALSPDGASPRVARTHRDSASAGSFEGGRARRRWRSPSTTGRCE
mmetsp:Transcript_37059/g.116594  ORF Transcript_37059/g.116594 Transcript_37059/m.116594 type:complete len:232 (-) Transcript_37059:35-730(-)